MFVLNLCLCLFWHRAEAAGTILDCSQMPSGSIPAPTSMEESSTDTTTPLTNASAGEYG